MLGYKHYKCEHYVVPHQFCGLLSGRRKSNPSMQELRHYSAWTCLPASGMLQTYGLGIRGQQCSYVQCRHRRQQAAQRGLKEVYSNNTWPLMQHSRAKTVRENSFTQAILPNCWYFLQSVWLNSACNTCGWLMSGASNIDNQQSDLPTSLFPSLIFSFMSNTLAWQEQNGWGADYSYSNLPSSPLFFIILIWESMEKTHDCDWLFSIHFGLMLHNYCSLAI